MLRSVGLAAQRSRTSLIPLEKIALRAQRVPRDLKQRDANAWIALTVTPHPTFHPGHIKGMLAFLKERGIQPRSQIEALQLLRTYLKGANDFADPPTHAEEYECSVLTKGLLVRGMIHARDAEHLGELHSWTGGDHDGQNLPPFARQAVRRLEIQEMCTILLEEMGDAPEYEAAVALVKETSDLARSGAVFDLRAREEELERLLPPDSHVARVVERHGMRLCEGQSRINQAALDGPKLVQIIQEMRDDPLDSTRSIVIADCDDPAKVQFLIDTLKANGLAHIEVVPLWESRKALDLLIAGAFNHLKIRTGMVAQSDVPKGLGIFLGILYSERAKIAMDAIDLIKFFGKGGGPSRSTGGSSPTANELALGCRDADGNAWVAGDRYTVQGPGFTARMLGDESVQELIDSLPRPPRPGEVVMRLTVETIDAVEKTFGIVIDAELANRDPKGEFALIYIDAKAGTIFIPFVGTRDLVKKDAVIAGPYQERAIKVATRLEFLFLMFGTAFARLRPDDVDRFIEEVNAMREGKDAGKNFLVDMMLCNWAMQAARMPEPEHAAQVWRKAGFKEADVELLGESARVVLDILDRTGYAWRTNPRVQRMVVEDFALEFNEVDPQANVDRVEAHLDELVVASKAYLDRKGQFTAVESASLRRSIHTLRDLASPPYEEPPPPYAPNLEAFA
ncbi:hypothetical protein [Ramlibacter sp.]|uniref:hypothetical protein n=1 Tax=Ramlibacter sp. TaxID=1917967 RepID=UPI003D10C0C6